MIVGIHHRERDERFAADDVRHAHRIRDERHLAQHRQGADLRDVEESLFTAPRKELLVGEIEQVVAPEGEGEQLASFRLTGTAS